MAVENARETPYASECRLLWRVAMLVFVVTIAIGLVNGQRIGMIDPQAERSILLTHLHTGTIGWVTLSLFGAVIWLFTAGRTATEAGGGPRGLARFAAVAVGVYPLTFYLFYPGGPMSSGLLLGIFGTLALAAIVGLLVWTVGQMGRVYMSVARLAAFSAVLNLTIGAILGVLIEAGFAGFGVPFNVSMAHPAMMTVGYLLPAAFTFVEWRLGGGIGGTRSIPGTIAVGLLLVGGWLAVAASILNLPALFPFILLFQLAAALILLIRMLRRIFGAGWLVAGGSRHIAIGTLAIMLDVGLLFYLVTAYFAPGLEPPRPLFIALAHTEFVGMMSNILFGSLAFVTLAQRAEVWPWADNVIFWGMNVGWIGFAGVEMAGALDLVRVFTPIMGLSLLLGIMTYWMRLARARL